MYIYIYMYIYNGKIYLKHFKDNGFLTDGQNISFSFLWNTDGAPLFNTSKISL